MLIHSGISVARCRDDVIVVLDRHFAGAGTKLASKGKKATDGTATPSSATPSKAGKDGTTTPGSNAAFEEQARKAAQVIRAAGYVSSQTLEPIHSLRSIEMVYRPPLLL